MRIISGAYERAVQCYAECIREFEQADDNSTYSRINFRKMLAEYGCCLLHLHMDDEAEKVLCKLEETGQSKEVIRETRLGVNVFLAYLAERNGDRKKAEEHVRQAVMALEDMITGLFRIRQYSESAPICGKDRQDGTDRGSIELSGTQSCDRTE